MKTVLLTGCAGFIGWKTASLLLEKNYRVVGADNLNDYYSVSLKNHRLAELSVNPGFEFHRMDIEDRDSLAGLFRENKFSCVINLAARAGVRYSIENPAVYLSTNALGTLNLLELTREFGVGKFVLASTSSLYAGQETPFGEDLPANTPISPYAATKKAAEALSYSYHFLHGLDVSVTRYFTVYGPAGRPDMSIFRFIKWIDEGSPVKVFGDGAQTRDFTYIDDIARGTVRASEVSTGYEIINLGSNKPYSINSLIRLIEECLGKKAVIETMPFNRADVKSTCAEISKAKKILDWEPRVPLAEGIETTVQWYKKNMDWVKDIKI